MRVIAAPTTEALTVDEVTGFIRVTRISERAQLTNFIIPSARADFEKFTGRALMLQTLEVDVRAPCWPVRAGVSVSLPRPPLDSIVSVNVLNLANELTVVPTDGYRAETAIEPHGLMVIDPEEWPDVETVELAPRLRIRFKAGVENASDVPPDLRKALMMWVSAYYENRSVITETSSGMLARVPDALQQWTELHCLYIDPDAR